MEPLPQTAKPPSVPVNACCDDHSQQPAESEPCSLGSPAPTSSPAPCLTPPLTAHCVVAEVSSATTVEAEPAQFADALLHLASLVRAAAAASASDTAADAGRWRGGASALASRAAGPRSRRRARAQPVVMGAMRPPVPAEPRFTGSRARFTPEAKAALSLAVSEHRGASPQRWMAASAHPFAAAATAKKSGIRWAEIRAAVLAGEYPALAPHVRTASCKCLEKHWYACMVVCLHLL